MMKKFRLEVFYEGKLIETKEFNNFHECYGYWEYKVKPYYDTKFYDHDRYIAENPHKVYQRYCRG